MDNRIKNIKNIGHIHITCLVQQSGFEKVLQIKARTRFSSADGRLPTEDCSGTDWLPSGSQAAVQCA